MSVQSEFAPAQDSVSWAEDAVEELSRRAGIYFESDVASVVREFDAETGENVQKLKITQPLPKELRRRATEALNNCKHAFDQATFAARNLTSGRSNKSVYFPWSSNPTDMKRLLENRGIDQRLWDVFAAHEPYPRGDTYPGGDDVIRTLATMANDKHTVGLTINGHISRAAMPRIIGRSIQRMLIQWPRWDPVNNEAELARWIGEADVGDDYRFGFEIAFKDARLAQPVNAVDALEVFSGKAKAVVEDLQRRCEELAA
jgi:hypothetical protein